MKMAELLPLEVYFLTIKSLDGFHAYISGFNGFNHVQNLLWKSLEIKYVKENLIDQGSVFMYVGVNYFHTAHVHYGPLFEPPC